ncbi:CoA-binding protein [Acidovorax sp. SRB_14]|uniref:CoA-binding protein n=1 Tax=Acidovorax sp. SRB_14 TaxID=1962699 RepID=UPI00146D9E2B|nr:CoA-binding protein [Acidovorax sp. SRB_14]NMM81314.1 CoA-binding protein [Acidovorax sp. SRB_14]NMM88860.1 CoA-binding protein [Rhodococcus sp. SRB_17]
MPHDNTSIAALLRSCRTIAVVGLSPRPERDSHHVAEYLQQQGYRIVPVNPMAAGQSILGEPCWPSLTEAARHHRIDLVDVFRNSAEVPPIAGEAIAVGARALWLQLGVRHDAAAAHARAAGLQVVQDRCTLVEHQRLVAQGALPGASEPG